ncbi:Smr/MutS family protein [Tenacibaculum agarivorans]|uniref:Smr/MutS family protein n=1 Tax=Tenacibaculum agarivorans TaxID=1908389 RepID=UPI00094BC193|nr:Smr/MutS family protein [Tenacibaculum agarivorans]
MCLQIGNKVAVLDDVIRGVIKKVEGGKILITTQENMDIWFYKSEVVKIDLEQNMLLKKVRVDKSFSNKEQLDIQKKTKKIFKKDKNEVIAEIDLHIEKLIKSTKGMDNYDILSIQIDTAKRKLEYFIQKKVSKIVFIHGVGEGVLKTELNCLLDRYPVKYYDASYQKYGLGATEVYVYQNP